MCILIATPDGPYCRVQIVMITGDNCETAVAIAQKSGIIKGIICEECGCIIEDLNPTDGSDMIMEPQGTRDQENIKNALKRLRLPDKN